MSDRWDVIIVGAGVGGLTAASMLVRAGWSWNYEDCPDYRPRALVRTPIQGLYMAGYQAFSTIFMGGVPTAMESGKRASEAVLPGSGPVEKMMIPVAG